MGLSYPAVKEGVHRTGSSRSRIAAVVVVVVVVNCRDSYGKVRWGGEGNNGRWAHLALANRRPRILPYLARILCSNAGHHHPPATEPRTNPRG